MGRVLSLAVLLQREREKSGSETMLMLPPKEIFSCMTRPEISRGGKAKSGLVSQAQKAEYWSQEHPSVSAQHAWIEAYVNSYFPLPSGFIELWSTCLGLEKQKQMNFSEQPEKRAWLRASCPGSKTLKGQAKQCTQASHRIDPVAQVEVSGDFARRHWTEPED